MLEKEGIGKPNTADMQFDSGSAEYAELAETDPNKQYVQYPEALRLMEELKGKTVLDIGCANGTLTRMMARRGAEVVAYDPSPEMIKAAKQAEEKEKLGIRYFVSDRPPVSSDQKFDTAAAVLVLLMAKDQKQLGEMFSYAYDSLKPGGKFVAITFNPDFKRFGEIAHNRRFTRFEGHEMQVEFFDNAGKNTLTVEDHCYSADEYEQAAQNAGFTKFSWEKLHVDPKGIEQKGSEFWKDFEEDCPYVGIVAYK